MHRRSLLAASLTTSCFGPAFALYDPRPDAALAGVQGAWSGVLTYRDYSKPDRLVSLNTRLFIALAAPAELVLHYVFDDGPGKTVYSYERMRFDFAAKQLSWHSGEADSPPSRNTITAVSDEAGGRTLAFERKDGEKTSSYTMRLSPTALTLSKHELLPGSAPVFRNEYVFKRPATPGQGAS